MISLFAVVAPPRSGTQWYARLFTHDGVYCFHELTTLLQPFPARIVLERGVDGQMGDHDAEQKHRRRLLEAHPRYFSRLCELAELGRTHVGNSDSALMKSAPGQWLLWPETRFLFSVRNGINVVNSRFAVEHSASELVRSLRPARLQRLPPFEMLCRRWTLEMEACRAQRHWLEERGAACLSTTLEGMTGDLGELERVWCWLVGDWERHVHHAESLMVRPVNARVNLGGVVHSAEAVWETWSDDQRTTFAEICGETQARLGYPIPG